MATAQELRELAGLLEQRATLEESVASLTAQRDRLHNENAAIVASLRATLITDIRQEVSAEVAAERAAIAVKQQQLDELLAKARQDNVAIANTLAKINSEAEIRISQKVAAAHAAARSALNAP